MSAVDPNAPSGNVYGQSSSKSQAQQELIILQQIMASLNEQVNNGAGSPQIEDQIEAAKEQIKSLQNSSANLQALNIMNVVCANLISKNAINEISNTIKKDPSKETELLPQLSRHENNLSHNDLQHGTTEDLLQSLESHSSEGS
jgi:hypothetical protein